MQIYEITWGKQEKETLWVLSQTQLPRIQLSVRKLSIKVIISSLSCDFINSYLQLTVFNLNDRDKSLLNTVCMLSCSSHVRLFATLWTITHHAPLSIRFSREEYWSGLPCPSPVDLPNPGIKPAPLMSPALAGRFSTTNATWEAKIISFSGKQFS